jgi:hypothetical protein
MPVSHVSGLQAQGSLEWCEAVLRLNSSKVSHKSAGVAMSAVDAGLDVSWYVRDWSKTEVHHQNPRCVEK